MKHTNFPPVFPEESYALSVEYTTTLPAAVIFEAWTTGWEQWFAAPGSLMGTAEVDLPFCMIVQHEGQQFPHYGRYLRVQADHLVELTWVTMGTAGAETVVTIELLTASEGTRIRLSHAGFLIAQARDEHEQAWPQVLKSMEKQLLS